LARVYPDKNHSHQRMRSALSDFSLGGKRGGSSISFRGWN